MRSIDVNRVRGEIIIKKSSFTRYGGIYVDWNLNYFKIDVNFLFILIPADVGAWVVVVLLLVTGVTGTGVEAGKGSSVTSWNDI